MDYKLSSRTVRAAIDGELGTFETQTQKPSGAKILTLPRSWQTCYSSILKLPRATLS